VIITMDRLRAEYGVAATAVLHVGAHLGEEAEAYARAGVADVLWVEGNPRLLAQLEQNVLRWPGQRAVGAVVADADDRETVLHLATFTMSSSLLPFKRHLDIYPTILVEHDEPVTTVTVDTLLERLDIPHDRFDFLNLDIEGAELLAFAGMGKVLPHLKWIYMEVNVEEMQEGCAMRDDVDAFLAERGFERVAYEDMGPQWGWGDALYRRVRAAAREPEPEPAPAPVEAAPPPRREGARRA
jgi:FkbM family methyltransferase